MQYQFIERREFVKTIEFKNSVALPNVTRIRYFKEEDITGFFLNKEFRYSFDYIIWSNWNTLTQTNLSSIQFRDNPNFYLEIKYTRKTVSSGNILRWYLIYDGGSPQVPPVHDTSINAWFFQGELPVYYLDRENQFGPYTSLILENVIGDSSVYGVYLDRYDSSLGTIFRFKGIEGVGGNVMVSEEAGVLKLRVFSNLGKNIGDSSIGIFGGYDSSGILQFRTLKEGNGIYLSYEDSSTIRIDTSIALTTDISTSHIWYDTVLDPCLSMPNSVGGIPAGTTAGDLYGENVTNILDNLLFPTVQPTLTAPFATFVMSPATTLYEVSANIAFLQFTTTFNQGSIYNGAIYQNIRSGSPNGYIYSGNNLIDVSSNSLTNIQGFAYNVGLGNQSWSSQVSYDSGPQPLDNKGNNAIAGPLIAGTLNSSPARTITGAYPLFATTVNITALTKQPLVLMTADPAPSTSGMLLVAESGGNKQSFEIPIAWPSPLVGIETYNTVSTQWEFELGSAIASLTRWTTSIATETIQGYTISYTQYTYNGPDRSSTSIRLQF
jgi:hypothetical protein